ncbi:DUF262 domain-containing protein [Litorilituus sediminis]|uniref:DUF262 domain-containing protein n=1 Tax=Litorilituus sediminis TaxID=718192 RepID=A0A4P6P6L1_9GAMM|nr:DUF262 domain-containing protein [Litorilituus sediminis]QBG35087.1 DUF262 domain-containing protein [Litorilituus sediminis]
MSEKGFRTYRLNEWCDKLGKEISIPIIQRGFVWKPEQIAGLWDSLLRGFPIGSFMVRPIARGSQNVELIDGQQRGRSIAGGVEFKAENGFRVWLACRYNTSNPEFKFDIKVTTDKHPFGFDSKFKKLSVSQRSKAFKASLCHKYLPKHDYSEDKSLEEVLELIEAKALGQDIRVSLEDTQPYSPKIKYVALDELIYAVQNNTACSPVESIRNIFECISNYEELNEAFLQELADALVQLIEKRYFYAIEVENHSYKKADNTKDIDIEVLFKRVGTGGTNLSDLDFAYSLIKQRLAGAKDYIHSLLKHHDISLLFSSLDCVDLLIRTSCFEAFVRNSCNPSETNMTDIKDHAKSTKKTLYKSIEANKDIIQCLFNSSKLENCLVNIIHCLKFNDELHPNGLPKPLLQKVPKKLWQMFVILSYSGVLRAKDNKAVSEALVRITLYWLLITPSSEDTAKIVHKMIESIQRAISKREAVDFDFEHEFIALIHNTSRKNNAAFAKLISLSNFRDLTVSNSGLIASNNIINTKYKLDIDDNFLIGKLFWKNKNLLLWLQRAYIHKLENDIGLKVLTDITLYDFDHIIPQHLWAGTSNVARGFKINHFTYDGHWEIGNSIGNYQLLKFSDNRAKKSATYDEWMSSLQEAKAQVLRDSILLNSDALFSQTVKKNQDWSDEQRKNFVKAVEVRVLDLYTELLSVYDEGSIYFGSDKNAIAE